MKKFLSSKIFLVIVFFIAGIAVTLAVQKAGLKKSASMQIENTGKDFKDPYFSQFDDLMKKFSNPAQKGHFFDNYFNDDFFNRSDDPFQKMDQFRQKMSEQFKDLEKSFHHDSFDNKFKRWFKNRFGGGNASDITTREDDRFVYYELNTGNLSPQNLKIDIKDNMVKITGKTIRTKENKENGVKSSSQYYSSFYRVLPVPGGTNADKAKVNVKNHKIIIKFPKT